MATDPDPDALTEDEVCAMINADVQRSFAKHTKQLMRNLWGGLTIEENAELQRLQREDYACSLGDRPSSPAAAKIARRLELEQLVREHRARTASAEEVHEAIEVGMRELQTAVGHWRQRRYPQPGASAHEVRLAQFAVLTEEVGEVARVLGKTAQGDRPETRGDLATELADVQIALLSLAAVSDVDLTEALARRWGEVQARKRRQ